MSSISGISNNYASVLSQMKTHSTGAGKHSKLIDEAFSKIDSANTGSFDISALTTAVNNALSSSQSKSSVSYSSNDIQTAFSKIDSDSDGKVTKQEFSSTMSQLMGRHHQHENDSSSNSRGMNEQSMSAMSGIAGMNGMPPPPPNGGPEGNEAGMSGMGGMNGMRPPPPNGGQGENDTNALNLVGRLQQKNTGSSANADKISENLLRQVMQMMESYSSTANQSATAKNQFSASA